MKANLKTDNVDAIFKTLIGAPSGAPGGAPSEHARIGAPEGALEEPT